MELLQDHEIIVGCYEEFVLGFRFNAQSSLTPTFSNHAHAGPVRTVAASGKYFVSGGADENVKIFNLRKRAEHGTLGHHDGTIACAVFHEGGKYLLTGSDDHKICILKCSNWSVEKTLLKHQATVTHIAIHPSGKLALSVGRDRKLITWNLIKGRSAYVTNVKEEAEFVGWSPGGLFYVVGFFRHADVYDVGTATVVYSVPVEGRANAAVFLDDDTLIVVGDNPNLVIHSVAQRKCLHICPGHERRIRGLHLERGDPSSDSVFALVTVSNDGLIKIWRGERLTPETFSLDLALSYDAKCRITCLAVHHRPETKDETALERPPASPVAVPGRKKRARLVEDAASLTDVT